MMQARWYQKEAEEKTLDFLEKNPNGKPLIVLPTGAGKSYVIQSIVKKLVNEGNRILVVSHVGDIVQQDYDELIRVLPEELVGIYSAKLKRKERRIVTVASIQSIHKKTALFESYKYIFVDEAHTIPAKGNGMYRSLFSNLNNARVIGLTATPFRLGTGSLVYTENALFTDIVIDVPVERLIKEGYLSPLLTNGTKNKIKLDKVRIVRGDYDESQLSEQVDKKSVTDTIVDELVSYDKTYSSILLFTINISHCNHVLEILQSKGVSCCAVHSGISNEENKRNLDLFKQRKINYVVSVSSLTTGFNYPGIDLIALLRPTKSPVLHIQMIGRGLRISPQTNKKHCLILDFAGNIKELGPINDVHIAVKGKGKKGALKEPLIKECPECFTHLTIQATACYMCGYKYPTKDTSLDTIASSLQAIIPNKLKKLKSGWHVVSSVSYKKYRTKNQGSLCLLVSYTLNTGHEIKEYINPFINTKRGVNNKQWWKYRSDIELPKSIDDIVAICNSVGIKEPVMLNIDFSGTYPIIKNASFN